ncbi:MAG: response regulator, partial [Planctomycetaceae bacterium]|nr:response regulator [Planctomycetaceae bacterium]
NASANIEGTYPPQVLELLLKPLFDQLDLDQLYFSSPGTFGGEKTVQIQMNRRKYTSPVTRIRQEFSRQILDNTPRNRPWTIFDSLALEEMGIRHSIGWAFVFLISPESESPGGVVLMHHKVPEDQVRCIKLAVGCGQLLSNQFQDASMPSSVSSRKAGQSSEDKLEDSTTVSQQERDRIAETSHELRSPLNGIVGMMRLLGETGLSEEQQAYLQVLQSSSSHLMDLVNGLLDQKKLQAGKLELDPLPVDFRTFLVDLLRSQAASAHQKGLELLLSVEPAIPDKLVFDEMRLRQVVVNLLSNAIKFTSQGEVTVRVQSDGQNLEFLIRDTGVGIASNRLDAIFEDYVQAERGTSRQYGGTGLGLGICRDLIRLMGGEIAVESRQNQGSTFRFHIPLDMESGSSHQKDSPSIPPAKILVVGECEKSCQCLVESFHPSDADVYVANSVDQLSVFQSQAWDMVVFDLAVTTTNAGAQLLQVVHEGFSQSRLLLLRPAHAHQISPELSGLLMGEKLLKPALPQEILNRWSIPRVGLSNRSATEEHNEPSCPRQQEKTASEVSNHERDVSIRCLVADDDPVNLRLLEHELRKKKIHVELACDGTTALESAIHQSFDLIFVDISMPGISGIDVASELRKQNKTIPLVAVTGYTDSATAQNIYGAGFTSQLSKPWTPDQLHQLLDRLLNTSPS